MRLYGVDHLHRLNNNESHLGPPEPSRRVLEGFAPARDSLYPSGDTWYLRQRLGEKFGLGPEQFLVGKGANEVIAFVIKAFCQEGNNIVTADKTFAIYEWVAEFSSFEASLVPLKDFGFDDWGMLEAIDQRTKILFVCNPNNPTGSYWDEARLCGFLEAVDDRQIVVVDVIRRLIRDEREYLRAELTRLGLTFHLGEGCFVMVRLPMSDTLAYRKFMSKGVMIRSMTGFYFLN